jgi:hypothetical protein
MTGIFGYRKLRLNWIRILTENDLVWVQAGFEPAGRAIRLAQSAYRSSRYSAAAPPDTAEERRRVQDVAAAAGLGEHGVAIAPGGIARKVGR